MEIILKKIDNKPSNTIDPAQDHSHRLKELEGECRVHSLRPLQIDWLKSCLIIIPLICSFVGLLLIKYYKIFRVRFFYKDSPYEEATYVFIEGSEGVEDI